MVVEVVVIPGVTIPMFLGVITFEFEFDPLYEANLENPIVWAKLKKLIHFKIESNMMKFFLEYFA